MKSLKLVRAMANCQESQKVFVKLGKKMAGETQCR